MTNKRICYRIQSRIQLETKKEIYLDDPVKGHQDGYIYDEELVELLKGKPIFRMVDTLDGNHGFITRKVIIQDVYLPALKKEKIGEIRLDKMNEYPFDHGEIITIQLKKNKDMLKIKISSN